MGYTTDFSGQFELNKMLDKETAQMITQLAQTRRMKRDTTILKELGFTGDYGVEGEFFAEGDYSTDVAVESITDYNRPPSSQPSLYLQWIPTEDWLGICWDENEKFNEYEEWIRYLIDKILEPKGYVLNGDIEFQGECFEDRGLLRILDNHLTVMTTITYS